MSKQKLKLGICILLSFLISSCELLIPDRSFTSEMDNDGQNTFQPNVDFPVVEGDAGKVRPSANEVLERTPQTAIEKRKRIEKLSLQKELSQLVGQLDDDEYRHYQTHKRKLNGISEKIYFLKISSLRERDEYLLARGYLEDFREMAPGDYQAVRERDIVVGMNKQSVLQSWGQPTRIEVAGNPKAENERWAFYDFGRVKYVFFESGRVSGWLIE